jgi:ribose-phosphate pyrophosphokinase
VKDLNKVTIVSPDAGRTKASEKFATKIRGAKVAFIHKMRDVNRPNKTVSDVVVGDVRGRVCIVNDDLIDTGGTILSAINLLVEAGAKEIYVTATHGIFSKNAADKLEKSAAKAIVVTNTVPIKKKKQFKKLEILSIAPLIANAIDGIFHEEPLGALFQAS